MAAKEKKTISKPKKAAKPSKNKALTPLASSVPPGETKSKALVKKPSSSVAVSRVDPLLQAYLKEVQRYPLLTREEEHELAIRVREHGDREALQRLVTSNLRFVVKIAYEYIHYRVKLLDLIQEGNMGLVKAVQDFDPYKEVRLTTYAVWWIRSYIQDAILKNHSLVKMGTTQAQKKTARAASTFPGHTVVARAIHPVPEKGLCRSAMACTAPVGQTAMASR